MNEGEPLRLIEPDWPAPAPVRAFVTTRSGGVSRGRFASLNLAAHVGDRAEAVAENRRRLCRHLGLPREPTWLQQVHGTGVVELGRELDVTPVGDAAVARRPGMVCAVLTADCLPVLLCERGARAVAAVHVGWRGLAGGVLERTLEHLDLPPARLAAWIGPGIGAGAYEVGPEVRQALLAGPSEPGAIRPSPRGRWLADLAALARARLRAAGVESVHGGAWCTAGDPGRFFSHRRDGRTGRMATLIWLDPAARAGTDHRGRGGGA